ncbi:MAG: DMT family transporter [Bacillota bacterium]
MGKYIALLFAGLVGIASGIQPSINAALGKFITPKGAALVSFVVGLIALAVINLFSGTFSQIKGIWAAPWYLWIGGLFGAFLVYVSIEVLPIIGAGAMMSAILSLQLITGVIIDHYGWLGTKVIPFDLSRGIGVVLLVIGVRMIVR